LGYDGVELFRRGRFRPATFWKTEKCTLVGDAVHKDRTLLTSFELVGDSGTSTHDNGGNGNMRQQQEEQKHQEQKQRQEGGKKRQQKGKGGNKRQYWHVLNCHLQAGPEGKRRVRQIDEGVKACFNTAKKLNEPDPANPFLIVCGDFNGGSECGALHYLERGEVGPTFIEDGEPVTSKLKKSKLSFPMVDVAARVNRDNSDNNGDSVSDRDTAPPTLVVAELISQMVEEGSGAYESPQLSNDLVQRLERCYRKYASHPLLGAGGNDEKVMNKQDVERWLIDINQQVGRGSEFRTAAKEMGWTEPVVPADDDSANSDQKVEKPRIFLPEDGVLSLQGFLNVYSGELRGGKFWGINYDLAIMGEALPDIGVFQARYDRIYCSSSLVPTAVLDTISKTPCPNEIEPSDHLPVAASFQMAGLN